MHLSQEPLRYTFQDHEIVTDLWSGGSGDLATVIGLHGFTGSGADFEPLLDDLGDGLKLVAPDLPGHGAYASPDSLVFYGESAGKALTKATLGQLQQERAWLLGYSMGARLALHMAISQPDLVEGLILIGGRPGLGDPEERLARVRSDEQWAELLEQEGRAVFLEQWQAQPLIGTQRRIASPYREHMQARRNLGNARGWASSLRAFGTGVMGSLWHELDSLRCPVALVVGEEDHKFLAIAKKMQVHIAQSELVVIAGEVGHAAHLESPRMCGSEIRRIVVGASG